MKTKIDTMVKLQRIDFAMDQINLELQDRLDTGWRYDNRNAREIREILFTLRKDYGRWIPNHIATEDYRTSLESEIHELLGVKPRLELDENDDGDDQWIIRYPY
jgi:thymidylate synthase ThyX